MAFDPQNDLEKSLMQAAADPAHRPQFYRDLTTANFFVIQEGVPSKGTGWTTLTEDYSLQIRPMEWNGKTYFPVFSSLPRLQAALTMEAGYIAINALEFMKLTQGANLLLNPNSDCGKELPLEEIATIIDGSIWRSTEKFVATKPSEVLIGQPANYPQELAEALSRYFANTKEVKRAFLAHFFHPERDEKPHTLIAIEVSDNWDAVLAGAGMIARDVPSPDPPTDIMQLTSDAKSFPGSYFLHECKPFYRRKLWGIW